VHNLHYLHYENIVHNIILYIIILYITSCMYVCACAYLLSTVYCTTRYRYLGVDKSTPVCGERLGMRLRQAKPIRDKTSKGKNESRKQIRD
jgi:hypothetical protein